MSVKIRQALIKCLEQIENETFDEETIRTLLIVSREYIGTDGLIKELAHFIAHPIRNQGIFHRKLNSRYTKLKIVEEQVSKFNITELQEKIKTEAELSDFMLGGISVEKVESKLFEILYFDGLEDLPDSHLKKYTGLNKKEIKKLLDEFYIKKEGYYYLSTNRTENLINAFRRLPNSLYNPEIEVEISNQLLHAENTAKKIKHRIDEIQKVVRGAIFYNSVFETEILLKEIESSILQVIKQFNIDNRFIKVVKERIDEILLCIMTLLHDSKFVFYDKNIASAYLSFYLTYDPETFNKPDFNQSEAIYESGVIALYITYKTGDKTMSIPLYVSDLPIKKYLKNNIFLANPVHSSFLEIKWITASRVENELQLTEI